MLALKWFLKGCEILLFAGAVVFAGLLAHSLQQVEYVPVPDFAPEIEGAWVSPAWRMLDQRCEKLVIESGEQAVETKFTPRGSTSCR